MQLAPIASWLTSAALLGAAVAAQQEETAKDTAAVAASAETSQTADKKLAALIARFEKQQNDTYDAYAKAATQSEKDAIWAKRPGKEYIPEFRAVAEEAEGTDTAAKAWMWVLRLHGDDTKAAWEVADLLLTEHIRSPVIEELASELRYAAHQHGEARVIEALRSIVAESPHERVRAAALFTLGAVLLDSDKAENKDEGRDCFEAVVSEYGSLSYGGDSNYKVAAQGYLYELDKLQIGMAAPDFDTVDENGAKWKLSDYRGKVVVVDFWGFW
jgi:hypothetical protein